MLGYFIFQGGYSSTDKTIFLGATDTITEGTFVWTLTGAPLMERLFSNYQSLKLILIFLIQINRNLIF
jgi:hypothetical protein